MDENFSTPKQIKRLGLRRSSSSIKNNKKLLVSTTKCGILETENPVSTPKTRLLQSDVKINYKDLEQNTNSEHSADSKNTPSTPKNATSDLQRLAVSTNCRPYRLALSKKVGEKMTKKRLEFYLANEIESEESVENDVQLYSKTEKSLSSREVLLDKIETAQNELKARQEHLKKVEELQEAINIWKSGFSSALHDLQEKVEPPLETAALLERLRIPKEMIKYIND